MGSDTPSIVDYHQSCLEHVVEPGGIQQAETPSLQLLRGCLPKALVHPAGQGARTTFELLLQLLYSDPCFVCNTDSCATLVYVFNPRIYYDQCKFYGIRRS